VLLGIVALGLLAVPLALRPLNHAVVGALPPLGYLPSLEIRRQHRPFNQASIEELQYGQPRWVFIGDSMLGSRIDPAYLGSLSSTGDELVSFLFHPATGPAWWYLSFKNHLVPSGITPRMTFFFFRDTNLTDTMFRLALNYGTALDDTARPEEPALDRLVALHRKGPWYRTRRLVDAVYQADLATSWMEPWIRRWWIRWAWSEPAAADAFEWKLDQTFGIDARVVPQGVDLAQSDVSADPDFARDLPTSVLPLIMQLSQQHKLPVCFVRVQRRPVGNRSPEDSPALARYVADLKTWVERQGACFHDDTGDPGLTLDLYADGDHVADRRRYTEIFRTRLDPLFR
jgi:hypothetical protein